MTGSRSVSILMRLAPQALSLGRLAGRVEIVETGEVTQVKDSEELLAFLRDHENREPMRQGDENRP